MCRSLAGEPDIVDWWPLDEGDGDTARDGSGRGNHGEIRYAEWETLPARRG